MRLVREHASSAWGAVSTVLSTSATALFGIAMFIVALFAFSTKGDKTISWLRNHSPLRVAHFDRLARSSDLGRIISEK